MADDQVKRPVIAAANSPSRFCASANGIDCRDCSRKLARLVAICAILGACTPPSPDTTAELPHEFNLNCSVHWSHENPSFPRLANLAEQHYHIDLSQGLVNYSVPLSATPIQLTWTSDHDGYMYHITINRLTGALYDMQLFPSGLRTGYDISGTCEVAPPPPPQPRF